MAIWARTVRVVRRAAAAAFSFVREVDYWNRRQTIAMLAPDNYALLAGRPADTYDEFLARTAGPLIREPSARARLCGRPVG